MGLACQTAGHGGLMSDGQAAQIQLVGRGQTLENSLIRIVFAPPCSLMIPLYKGIAQKSTIILVDFTQ